MNYKEALIKSMKMLAEKENSVFLGYNISFGSKAYGTLLEIPAEKKIETPVAENLMIGLATGLALEGFFPIVFFERHDFILNAMDAIVNHVDKIESMSKGQFKTPMIIRAVIGSSSPLNPGPQHTQDFTDIFKNIFKNILVFEPKNPQKVLEDYKKAMDSGKPCFIIERKDWYNVE